MRMRARALAPTLWMARSLVFWHGTLIHLRSRARACARHAGTEALLTDYLELHTSYAHAAILHRAAAQGNCDPLWRLSVQVRVRVGVRVCVRVCVRVAASLLVISARGCLLAASASVTVSARTHTHTHTHAHTHTHTRTHTHMRAHTQTHTRAHTHTQTRAHARAHGQVLQEAAHGNMLQKGEGLAGAQRTRTQHEGAREAARGGERGPTQGAGRPGLAYDMAY